MVTGSPPWHHAETRDYDFAAYLGSISTDDLYNNFYASVIDYIPASHSAKLTVGGLRRISHELNVLLRKILVIDPLKRISLAEIREEVLKIPTFWSTSDILLPNTENIMGQDLPYEPLAADESDGYTLCACKHPETMGNMADLLQEEGDLYKYQILAEKIVSNARIHFLYHVLIVTLP
jgi:serine/threonine protein kinase